TDVLVVGTGIAGAAAALAAAEAGAEVLLLCKDELGETNTAYAQGGIAVVQLPEDSAAQHIADTLKVGAGVAEREVVEQVVRGAGDAIAWLDRLGARFDRIGDGPDAPLDLSREGGHSFARVV